MTMTHGCNYLLADDIDMEPVPGYRSASCPRLWHFVMKPDLSTIRPGAVAGEDGAGAVRRCSTTAPTKDLPHSPRGILRRQIRRLQERGYLAYFASELDSTCSRDHDSARRKRWPSWRPPRPISATISSASPPRKKATCAACATTCSGRHPDRELQGRVGPGQERSTCASRGAGDGRPPRFPQERAKRDRRTSRQGRQLHGQVQLRPGRQLQPRPQLAVERRRQDAAVLHREAPWTLPSSAGNGRRGSLKYAKDYTYFHAPYVNSHKPSRRTFAPTKIMLRGQPHRRLPPVRGGHQGIRMECRIGGRT